MQNIIEHLQSHSDNSGTDQPIDDNVNRKHFQPSGYITFAHDNTFNSSMKWANHSHVNCYTAG